MPGDIIKSIRSVFLHPGIKLAYGNLSTDRKSTMVENLQLQQVDLQRSSFLLSRCCLNRTWLRYPQLAHQRPCHPQNLTCLQDYITLNKRDNRTLERARIRRKDLKDEWGENMVQWVEAGRRAKSRRRVNCIWKLRILSQSNSCIQPSHFSPMNSPATTHPPLCNNTIAVPIIIFSSPLTPRVGWAPPLCLYVVYYSSSIPFTLSLSWRNLPGIPFRLSRRAKPTHNRYT